MQKEIAKYGIIQNKSLTLKFPDKKLIPDNMIRHVIRGIFDGDGGFKFDSKRNSWNIAITGTKEIVYEINEYSPYKGSFEYAGDEDGSNTWRWILRKQLDIIEFCEWIYTDNNVCMDRKYYKMLQCLNSLKSRKLYLEKEKAADNSTANSLF